MLSHHGDYFRRQSTHTLVFIALHTELSYAKIRSEDERTEVRPWQAAFLFRESILQMLLLRLHVAF